MFNLMQLDPNRIKFIMLHVQSLLDRLYPRTWPPAYVPPTHSLPFSPFHQPPCTKSVGEHWQLPRLYRGSRRELLGVRLLPHGHHEHRRLRRRRLHDPPRPHRHRLLPPLRAGKWGGRSWILASPDTPCLNQQLNENFILTKRDPCPPQPNGQTHNETFVHLPR